MVGGRAPRPGVRGQLSPCPWAQPAGPSLTASEPPGSQSIPFPLDPLLATKAGPPDLPAPPAPHLQLLPKGLEWKGPRTVIWSRKFSGDRLDQLSWGAMRGSIPRSGQGRPKLVWNLQMDLEQTASCEAWEGPWHTPTWPPMGHRELHPSPTLCHPLPPKGALNLEPILPWNKQCVLRNHTQACDIYGYGVNESICLSTNVWAPVGLWGVGGDNGHGARGPLLGSLATSL